MVVVVVVAAEKREGSGEEEEEPWGHATHFRRLLTMPLTTTANEISFSGLNYNTPSHKFFFSLSIVTFGNKI